MPPLVGRDPELATIDRFLRSVREGYQAVVFRGGAGYGKSALLEETVARARAAGFRALTARPAETEAELPFGVLAELLEPVGMSELDLPAPQARALDVALRQGRTRTRRVPIDPLGLSLAVVAALRELADEQPLLVALDDLQWCDPPSLRTLEFALRRVESEQIGLVAGLRSGRRAGDPGPGGERTPHRRRGRAARRGQPSRPSCVAALDFPDRFFGSSTWRATGIRCSARRSRHCSPSTGSPTTPPH